MACIQNGILIEFTHWVTIGIMLPAYHLASGNFVPSWEQYFSIHLLVPPLWGYLWFFVQQEKHFGILQIVLVWIILWCVLHTLFNQISQLSIRTQFLM